MSLCPCLMSLLLYVTISLCLQKCPQKSLALLESGRRTHPLLPSSSAPAGTSPPPLLTQAWASRTSSVSSTICRSPASPSCHADAPQGMAHKPGKKEKEERVKERSMGALQHWVYVQRSLHRAGVLPEPRRHKLDAIGFLWHPDRDLGWERCYLGSAPA